MLRKVNQNRHVFAVIRITSNDIVDANPQVELAANFGGSAIASVKPNTRCNVESSDASLAALMDSDR